MQIVYSASSESQEIHVWKMNNEGKLILLQIVKVSNQVRSIVLNPTQSFLYAGIRPKFRVITFNINKDGILNELGQTPLPGSPTHVSTDHYGNFLFCSSYKDSCVSISPIGENGIPLAPIQVVKGLTGCHSANISNDNRILFVPALKQDRIWIFNFSLNGKLTPYIQKYITTSKGSGPRHIAFNPNRYNFYCINELNGTVDVWKLNNEKDHNKIRCIQSLNIQPDDFKGVPWASDIHLTPDGCYLYACDRTSSKLTIFAVNEDGLLTLKGYQPTEIQPRSFTIDRRGQYLISAGQKSNHIEVYRIDKKKGSLIALARYIVGQEPICIVTHTIRNRFDIQKN